MGVSQCVSKARIWKLRCQGAKGHKGQHWSYDGGGWFHLWPNQRGLRAMDVAHQTIPPGHARYVSPVEMDAEHYIMVRIAKERKKR